MVSLATMGVLLRDVVHGSVAFGTARTICAALMGMSTALAILYARIPTRLMRLLEFVLFASLAGSLVLRAGAQMATLVAQGNSGLVIAGWHGFIIQFVLVLGAFSLLVPRPLISSVVGIVVLAGTPLVVGWRLLALAPPTLGLTAGETTGSLVGLALATVLAITGAAVVSVFQKLAIEARDLRMYRLIEKLGAGGMGEVWLAEHAGLARPAAIKVIRPEALATTGSGNLNVVAERFQNEARATAKLRSPNTVEIYDFGHTKAGVLYYVMEYLGGVDLQALINRFGPLPPERAVHLLKQACLSLGDAHDNGLIHRDVKPANLQVTRLGLSYDVLKVLDFGLVKETAHNPSSGAHLTGDGVAPGTPAFMAPEMATASGPIDARSDIYGLGCVAYWLLTGQLVFAVDTPMQQIVAHASETPRSPSAQTELPIPPALDEVVLKCLSKDPNDRYATAIDLFAALETLELDASWGNERAEAWWRAHLPAFAGLFEGHRTTQVD